MKNKVYYYADDVDVAICVINDDVYDWSSDDPMWTIALLSADYYKNDRRITKLELRLRGIPECD